ncbi:MAG TPA: hypothetical protein VFB62_07950 [Polyangiaceae bacterium]|nr:hypothetical protein [Polyangiaceae bacterium]
MMRHALLLAWLSSGCSLANSFDDPPIVGDWIGLENANNEMTIDVEGDGELALFYSIESLPDVSQHDVFEVSWEHEDSDTFVLVTTCSASTTSCQDNNPVIVCNIEDDDELLVCSTNHPLWQGYEQLDWSEL